MDELALFAGVGGGLLGSQLLGWNTKCACEIHPYARSVLLARQADGSLDRFPVWDDVRTFDGKPWAGRIGVITGGFPCQDISAAGIGKGLAGARSGLWFEMLRIIGEVRPRYVFAENSPNLRTRGLGTVIEGLTGLGYGVRWGVLGARHFGAPHKRNRMWILADAYGGGFKELRESKPQGEQGPRGYIPDGRGEWRPRSKAWDVEPGMGRVADGVAHRVDRLRATGNGQVPEVAARAWEILTS